MASGDHCRFGHDEHGRTDGTVIHFDCDDHGDGTVTDWAGRVIKYRPKHWLVEEKEEAK